MWKRLFPKGFLQAAQTKQVVCHVCLKACITSWGKEPQFRTERSSGEKEAGLTATPGLGHCKNVPSGSRTGSPGSGPQTHRGRLGVADEGLLLACWVRGSVCAHISCDISPPIKLGREAAYYCHFTKGASSVKATQRYMVRRFAFQKLPKSLQAMWPRDTIISHFKFICSLVHWWQTNALLG